MKTKGLAGYLSENDFVDWKCSDFDELLQRVRDIENDLKALFDYFKVKAVTYKQYQTGIPSDPWRYGRQVIKKSKLD